MAGQKRGLILGLASLAGSTGRIRESKERQSVLSSKLRLDDLEARLRQRALDDADRERRLSDLLGQHITELPGMTETTVRPFMRGALQTEQTPTAEARFLSDLIQSVPANDRAYLYSQLMGGRHGESEDAQIRRFRFLSEQLGLPQSEAIERSFGGIPREPKGEKSLHEKRLEYENEVGQGTQELLDKSVGPLAPGKAYLTQPQAEAQTRSNLAAVGGVDVPGRLPTAVSTVAADPKIAMAKKQIADAVDSILDREVQDESQKDQIAQWLKDGNSPMFNVLRGYAELPTPGNLTSLQKALFDIAHKSQTGKLSGLEALGVPVNRGFMGSKVTIP